MKLTIEPTDECVLMGDTPCRVWNGRTEAGVPCVVFVCLLRVDRADDHAEFDRDLIDVTPPDSWRNCPHDDRPDRNR